MRKYIFMLLAAVMTFMTGCQDDKDPIALSGLSVSQSYVTLPLAGGSTKITVNSATEWIITGADKAEWLTISATEGHAGETEITFSAALSEYGKTVELKINSADQVQYLNVTQGVLAAVNATCAEIIAGPDNKNYRVTGVVTSITNTLYGNWLLKDDTGEITIYGTLDQNGAEKNFESLGIEVGDEVTVEGPKLTYGTTVELVNVNVVKINKWFIQVDSVANDVLPADGGIFEAYLLSKGEGVSVEIPEADKEWLSIASIEQNAGKVASEVTVKFNVGANTSAEERVADIEFYTINKGKKYYATAQLTQQGMLKDATTEEFNNAGASDLTYRVSGLVTEILKPQYGSFNFADAFGEIYVYGSKNFANFHIEVGDIVTITSKYNEFNGSPQMKDAIIESVCNVKTVTVEEFLAAKVDNNQYYKLTGTVQNIKNTTYGNFDLVDESGTIYVYGLLTGWNGLSKQFASLNLKEGDKITILGTRADFNGTAQVGNGAFLSTMTE